LINFYLIDERTKPLSMKSRHCENKRVPEKARNNVSPGSDSVAALAKFIALSEKINRGYF